MLNKEYTDNKLNILKMYIEGYALTNIISTLKLSISDQVLNNCIKQDNQYLKNRSLRLKLEEFKDYIVNEYAKGTSINNLAKELDSDRAAIISILNKYCPTWELRSNSYYRKCKLHTAISHQQLDIINGILLSDGGLSKARSTDTARLVLKNTQQEWIDYTSQILPFQFSIHIIKATTQAFTVKNEIKYCLCKERYVYNSKADLFLEELYSKWYVNKIKIMPNDLVLTPTTILHWFYGDGSSSYNNKCITITLCTDNFTLSEVTILQNKFKQLGIQTHIHIKKKKHPRLIISKKSEVSKFYEYIKPVHCIKAFDYKFKAFK